MPGYIPTLKTKLLPLSVRRFFVGCIGLSFAAAARAELSNRAELKSAFESLDPARNGTVGIAEWCAAAATPFWRLDLDGNGFLTRPETGARRREATP